MDVHCKLLYIALCRWPTKAPGYPVIFEFSRRLGFMIPLWRCVPSPQISTDDKSCTSPTLWKWYSCYKINPGSRNLLITCKHATSARSPTLTRSISLLNLNLASCAPPPVPYFYNSHSTRAQQQQTYHDRSSLDSTKMLQKPRGATAELYSRPSLQNLVLGSSRVLVYCYSCSGESHKVLWTFLCNLILSSSVIFPQLQTMANQDYQNW